MGLEEVGRSIALHRWVKVNEDFHRLLELPGRSGTHLAQDTAEPLAHGFCGSCGEREVGEWIAIRNNCLFCDREEPADAIPCSFRTRGHACSERKALIPDLPFPRILRPENKAGDLPAPLCVRVACDGFLPEPPQKFSEDMELTPLVESARALFPHSALQTGVSVTGHSRSA